MTFPWRRHLPVAASLRGCQVLPGGAVSCSWMTSFLDSCFVVAAKVCPGGGATLSSRMGPVTTGTLCGSSRQSRLAGSMTSGTHHSLCRQGLRCLSVVLVLGCIAVRVGVRIRPYGQGLCLSLCGSGARVYCRARWCTNTAYGQGLRLFFRVLVLVCSVLDIFGVPVWCMRLAR